MSSSKPPKPPSTTARAAASAATVFAAPVSGWSSPRSAAIIATSTSEASRASSGLERGSKASRRARNASSRPRTSAEGETRDTRSLAKALRSNAVEASSSRSNDKPLAAVSETRLASKESVVDPLSSTVVSARDTRGVAVASAARRHARISSSRASKRVRVFSFSTPKESFPPTAPGPAS